MTENNQQTDHVDAQLARHGGLTYLEIPAVDVNASATFYHAILNWQCREDGTDRSKFADPTGHLIGRWVTGRAIARQPGLLPFIYVDHIDEAVKRVTTHGGEVVKAPYREGTLHVAVIRDPAGNILGLWQEGNR